MAETMTMHWLDWVVVALFFVLVLWVGIRSGKNINSSTDFFVGGGKIPCPHTRFAGQKNNLYNGKG